ncbi:hypothetical protein AB833_21765 [Chromatiales bacterium (ex Bugula neritina AB1)]|nr:hypothetical protein AB833_21765 [Chromatiales bacterium (ex Bugula neritina AB1)]
MLASCSRVGELIQALDRCLPGGWRMADSDWQQQERQQPYSVSVGICNSANQRTAIAHRLP